MIDNWKSLDSPLDVQIIPSDLLKVTVIDKKFPPLVLKVDNQTSKSIKVELAPIFTRIYPSLEQVGGTLLSKLKCDYQESSDSFKNADFIRLNLKVNFTKKNKNNVEKTSFIRVSLCKLCLVDQKYYAALPTIDGGNLDSHITSHKRQDSGINSFGGRVQQRRLGIRRNLPEEKTNLLRCKLINTIANSSSSFSFWDSSENAHLFDFLQTIIDTAGKHGPFPATDLFSKKNLLDNLPILASVRKSELIDKLKQVKGGLFFDDFVRYKMAIFT